VRRMLVAGDQHAHGAEHSVFRGGSASHRRHGACALRVKRRHGEDLQLEAVVAVLDVVAKVAIQGVLSLLRLRCPVDVVNASQRCPVDVVSASQSGGRACRRRAEGQAHGESRGLHVMVILEILELVAPVHFAEMRPGVHRVKSAGPCPVAADQYTNGAVHSGLRRDGVPQCVMVLASLRV